MAAGRYQAARVARITYEVRMDDVGFFRFHDKTQCIGTDGLNSCTVVTIVSSLGAIFAHIAPDSLHNLHGATQDFGVQHMREKMGEVERLYRTYQEYFPPGKTTWIISAIYRGSIALPEQKRIVEESLANLGLEYSNAAYLVVPAPGIVAPPKGTVFIDARGGRPVIYVEDQIIST